MQTGKNTISRYLFCAGLSREDFELVTPLVTSRNMHIAQVTSFAGLILGAIYMLANLAGGFERIFPYIFLAVAEVAEICILHSLKQSSIGKKLAACYLQVIIIIAYAILLSLRSGNSAIPGTSIIVFLALMPITLYDRPIRMHCVIVLLSAGYLIGSSMLKEHQAFILDVENAAAFTLTGQLLYLLICSQAIREIAQSNRIGVLQRDIISTFAEVVEERDQDTGNHIERSEDFVRMLVREMEESGKFPDLTEEYRENIILGAPLHDIGKVKIPDHILNKPGKLTPEEFEIMKKHSEYGYEIILKTMGKGHTEELYLKTAANIARYHHERFDGKGYPSGLAGEEIPLEARIMALCDVYDALVSVRIYKPAFSIDYARNIIAEGRGTQFDPELTDLFLRALEKRRTAG